MMLVVEDCSAWQTSGGVCSPKLLYNNTIDILLDPVADARNSMHFTTPCEGGKHTRG